MGQTPLREELIKRSFDVGLPLVLALDIPKGPGELLMVLDHRETVLHQKGRRSHTRLRSAVVT